MCVFKWRDIIIIGGMCVWCKMYVGGDDVFFIVREKLSCNEKLILFYFEVNLVSI